MSNRTFIVVLSTLLAACYTGTVEIYPYYDAGPDADDAGTNDGGEEDGGIEAKSCEMRGGQCVPLRPLGWSDPILVAWSSGHPLECPPEAPVHHFTKYAELIAGPLNCACACKPSTGTCKLPAMMTAQNAVCYTPGAVVTSFDPPTAWDGACSNASAIAAGKQCDGKACVESLTIGPMEVVDEGCEVEEDPILTGTSDVPRWGLTVLGCEGFPEGGEVGCGSAAKCAPAPAPPPAFRVCVYQEGDIPCEGESYTERFVIYSGYDDKRTCTDCTCSPDVAGSLCKATASIYSDATCLTPLISGYPISSLKEVCLDLTPPGEALGSKAVSDVKYHPGTCQPIGGASTGEVERLRPSTICCRP